MTGTITVERTDAVLTVVLDAPPHNPISMAMADRLETLLGDIRSDASIRAVIITGAGERAFSVGGNIREFGLAVQKMGLDAFIDRRVALMNAVEALPKPVIAAIGGTCLGGGLELALACHLRLVSRDSRLGLPEIDLGVVPAWGGTQRLVRAVGRARALDMMLRARKLDADEALRIGLVNEVLADRQSLRRRAAQLAVELAEKAPRAVAAILRCAVQGADGDLQDGLALERAAILETATSRDAMEGISAFLSKRKPRFTGE